MADRLLYISWDLPVRGMEARAVEVFNEALGLLGRRQQEGKIESFDVALFKPGELGGYIVAKGSVDQIHALREDEEFVRNTLDSQMCVDGIKHIEGFCEAAVAEQMTLYNEAVARAPQHA